MLKTHVAFPRARSTNPIVRALRFVWTLPTNAFGHVVGIVVSQRRGVRVGGRAAVGWLYPIHWKKGLDWIGAVTLGHAIVHRRDILEGPRGRLVLVHELAHTRQHDVLGPLYLPLHVLAQTTSFVLSFTLGGEVTHSRVHDHNPLEQTFIAFGVGMCDEGERGLAARGLDPDRLLAEYGL